MTRTELEDVLHDEARIARGLADEGIEDRLADVLHVQRRDELAARASALCVERRKRNMAR